MIKIGLIGTESMHSWSFAEACNIKNKDGEYNFPDARVTAICGLDDNDEHIKYTKEKGNVDIVVKTPYELEEYCNAFMILQRDGNVHLKYAEYFIKKGYPVFIDKPICCTMDDVNKLKELAKENNVVLSGGSGLKFNKQVLELKDYLNSHDKINGGTINHLADIDCPYNGIFFYLPHAVEIMLTLFGYDPISVNTTYFSHDNFTVCVKYEKYMINLAINGSYPTYIVVNGEDSKVVEVDSSDIFVNNIGDFIEKIKNNEILKDTDNLSKSVEVILAVEKSLKENREISI